MPGDPAEMRYRRAESNRPSEEAALVIAHPGREYGAYRRKSSSPCAAGGGAAQW